jgi:hypothetical protein
MIGAITGPAVVLPRRSIFESRRQNGAAVRSHAYHGVMSIVYPLLPSGNAFIVLPSGNAFIVLPSGNAFIDATAIASMRFAESSCHELRLKLSIIVCGQ